MLFFFVFGEIGFETFGKFTAGEHNAPAAASALQANIRAQACDGPFIGTARMLFTQAQVIVEVQGGEHV
jgi:hypothetical protein